MRMRMSRSGEQILHDSKFYQMWNIFEWIEQAHKNKLDRVYGCDEEIQLIHVWLVTKE